MRFICSILAIALVSCCFAAEEATKLPHDAQAALDGYNKAVAKIQEDAAHKVNGEREKVYTTLDRSCKDAAKKGDVDGAIAIKAEMKKLLDQAQKDDDTDMLGEKTDSKTSMEGKWSIRYTNNAIRIYEITADGHLKFNGQTFKMEPDADGKGFVVKMGYENTLSHIKLNKTDLAVEHFNPAESYPKGNPDQLGVGTRVKDEPKK